MSVESFGVDAPFVDGVVTPFVSEATKSFDAVDQEIPREPRGRTLLDGPDTSGLGPEKGRLDRLYAKYAVEPNEGKLNILLAEVERYARRVTRGKGGAFRQYLHQSATDQYPASEISAEVTYKVWLNLSKFDGRSKFSVWVFRVACNMTKDKSRALINRRETNDDFEVVGCSKISLPTGGARTEGQNKLDKLLEELSPGDRDILDRFISGYTPRELGEHFNKGAKWASNSLNRIKKQLRKLAKERYPEGEVAKSGSSNVLVMKGETLPASQAA